MTDKNNNAGNYNAGNYNAGYYNTTGALGSLPTQSNSPELEGEWPKLQRVVIDVCQDCLDGVAGECHTPGCIQWIRQDMPGQLGERLDFEHRYELLANATRTAVEEARVDELNRLIGDIGSLIKGETWEDWGWRVKRAIEARLAALKEQKHE